MEQDYGTLCPDMWKKPNSWCRLNNSWKSICLIKILAIAYILFLNTILAFSLLQHVCLYFVCYSLHIDQGYGTVLPYTLSTCVVKRMYVYLMNMSCTLLWQINPVGFQSLWVCCKYIWTYANKIILSLVKFSLIHMQKGTLMCWN